MSRANRYQSFGLDGDNLESLCQTLVASANERGGKDNTTVVLVEVVGEP